MNLNPIIMLDFHEVIVLNRPEDVGGFGAISKDPPPGFWKRLFHEPAIRTLVRAIALHQARVVITTSWLRFLGRDGFENIFKQTELDVLSENLHECWEARQKQGETRAQAIDRWLEINHRGEPYVILDDELSGTGLRKSTHDRRGRVVLCKMDVGLHEGHLPQIRTALSKAP